MEQSFSLRSHPSPSGRPVSCWYCVTLGRCPNFSSLLAHWGVCMGVWGVVQSPWLINCCHSVDQSCPTLCDPMDCSMPALPAHHQLPEVTQTLSHQAFKNLKRAILSISSFHSILLNMSISLHFFLIWCNFKHLYLNTHLLGDQTELKIWTEPGDSNLQLGDYR